MTSVDATTTPPPVSHPVGPDLQVELLRRIAASLDELARRLAEPPVHRILYGLEDVATAVGLTPRTIKREIRAGRFPAPTIRLGNRRLWSPDALRAWIEPGWLASESTGRADRRSTGGDERLPVGVRGTCNQEGPNDGR